MPLPSFDEIKDRKVVQWGLAYLAGAWLVFQVVVEVGDIYAWPVWLARAVPVVLVVGLFFALVVAWYHGEQGRQRVSGIELGILSGVLAIAALGVMIVGGGEAGAESGEGLSVIDAPEIDQTAIAVLPFESIGADSTAYLAAGLTEEIQNVLATSPSLRVAATRSSSVFAGSSASIDSIGRALGVVHLVEGSVRAGGGRVRVSARLVDAESGLREWSETYERGTADLFGIQIDIARAIAYQLRARITAYRGRGTEDGEAYTLALEGRQVYEQGTDVRVFAPEAARLFQGALARDSTYAYAWAGLANALRLGAGLAPADQAEAERRRARSAAERAVALDPNEGWGHYALGMIAGWDLDHSTAQDHFERAVAANPSDARALGALARTLGDRGEVSRAVRVAGRVAALDPLSAGGLSYASQVHSRAGMHHEAVELARDALSLMPEESAAMAQLSYALLVSGDSEEAVAVAGRRAEAYPTDPMSLHLFAYALVLDGRMEDAVEYAERALDLAPADPIVEAGLVNVLAIAGRVGKATPVIERIVASHPDLEFPHAVAGYVRARAGDRAGAERALDALPHDSQLRYYLRAAVEATLGDHDAAFDALSAAVEVREGELYQAPTDPWFEPLHDDPRWDAFLRRVNFRGPRLPG